jgi:hypothetical protein
MWGALGVTYTSENLVHILQYNIWYCVVQTITDLVQWNTVHSLPVKSKEIVLSATLPVFPELENIRPSMYNQRNLLCCKLHSRTISELVVKYFCTTFTNIICTYRGLLFRKLHISTIPQNPWIVVLYYKPQASTISDCNYCVVHSLVKSERLVVLYCMYSKLRTSTLTELIMKYCTVHTYSAFHVIKYYTTLTSTIPGACYTGQCWSWAVPQ